MITSKIFIVLPLWKDLYSIEDLAVFSSTDFEKAVRFVTCRPEDPTYILELTAGFPYSEHKCWETKAFEKGDFSEFYHWYNKDNPEETRKFEGMLILISDSNKMNKKGVYYG